MPAWPVAFALGLVGLLIAGMVGLDVMLGQRVSNETDDIIENAQRSIVLLDGIRSNAQNLSEAGIPEAEIARRDAAIAEEIREYDPLAMYDGERTRWLRLVVLLHALSDAADQPTRSRLADEIDRSVDDLISINSEGGRRNATSIHDAHHGSIRDDAIVGAIALLLASMIAVHLIRLLARQRQLVADRVLQLDEKMHDLESFAARAAHDLRSPMNPIRGYADLLLEVSGSPQEVTMMAKRIRTSVDRMARVVDDMLALSIAGRPGAGVASTNEVAAVVLDELGTELHGVELTTDLAGGDVACSAGILQQILRNLMANAIKFRARTRPLKLRLSIHDAGPQVEIAVEDNGLGMDPETAAHAFEPLYRGRTDLEVPGHGLGLAIVERSTRALGGTCELSSAVDRGTRIVVRLPAS